MRTSSVFMSAAALAAVSALAACGSSSHKIAGPASSSVSSSSDSAGADASSSDSSDAGSPRSGTSTSDAASPAASSGDTSNSAAPPGATGAGPCKYLSSGDVTGVLGGKSSPGGVDHDPGLTDPTCKWDVADTNLGPSGTLRVRTNAERGDPTKFAFAKKGFPEAIDIAGIGDGAFYLPTLQALSFRVHGLEITVQYGDLTGDASPTSLQTDLVALAKKAAARG